MNPTLEGLVAEALDLRNRLDTLLGAIEDELGYEVDGLADRLEEFDFDEDGSLTAAPEED